MLLYLHYFKLLLQQAEGGSGHNYPTLLTTKLQDWQNSLLLYNVYKSLDTVDFLCYLGAQNGKK